MKKYTHIECLEDIVENDVILFKKASVYKIISFDYKSLIYYVEPEYYEDDILPCEYAIYPHNKNFKFISL